MMVTCVQTNNAKHEAAHGYDCHPELKYGRDVIFSEKVHSKWQC